MNLLIIYYGVASVILFNQANAANWMIDASCDAASGKQAFVRATMTNALTMARSALNSISNPPLNQGVQTALDYLFATGDPTVGTYYGSNMVFGGNGMTRLSTEVFSNANLGPDDVKIYCDQSRISRVNRRGLSFRYDGDLAMELREQDYSGCSILKAGFMYTVLPFDPAGSPFMQVQICPSFLTWALPHVAGNLWTVGITANTWKKLSIEAAKKFAIATLFSPIDGFMLVDKMMVHELTHANRRYTTEDVSIGLFGLSAYGWPQCRRLSTVATQPAPGVSTGAGPYGPELNADTWALFASIAWQFENNRISAINADGSFKP